MERDTWSKVSRWFALPVLAAGFALGAGQVGRAFAAGPIVCVAAAPAPSMNCAYSTATAVAAGGTLKLAVANPASVNITAVTGGGACTPAGLNTQTVTLSCPFPGAALAAGTPLQLTFSANTAPVELAITANANGPIVGLPGPTNVAAIACYPELSSAQSSCIMGITKEVVSNDSLDVKLANTGPGIIEVAIGAASPLGSCALSTGLPLSSAASLTLEYVCAAGQSMPYGSTILIDVNLPGETITIPGIPPFIPDKTIIIPGTPPTIALTENTKPATASVPASTAVTATFIDPAGLVPASATLSCSNVTVPAGGSGLTLSKFGGPESCKISPKTAAGVNPVADGVFKVTLVNSHNNAVLGCNGIQGCVVEAGGDALDISCGTSAPAGTTPSITCTSANFTIESALSYEIRTGGTHPFPGVDLSGSGVAQVSLSYTSTPGNGANAETLGTFQFVIGG